MDPKDYSEEILNKRFQSLVPLNRHPNGHRFTREAKSRFCQPDMFTIKEARDGVHTKNHIFKLSNTNLEKLRRAKPCQIIRFGSNYHDYNNTFAILVVDTEEEQDKKNKERLEAVNKEIKEKVGDLLKEQEDLRNKIKEYKILEALGKKPRKYSIKR